jgi:hypothetical protein
VFTAMITISAEAAAHHFGQAGFVDGQLAEIGIVPGGDALGDWDELLSQPTGVVPAERVGAAVPLGSWRRRRPHELQP